jgi:hypothetical protein
LEFYVLYYKTILTAVFRGKKLICFNRGFLWSKRVSYIMGFNPGSPRPWTHSWSDQGFCGANPIGPWGYSTTRKAMDGWFFTTESYS